MRMPFVIVRAVRRMRTSMVVTRLFQIQQADRQRDPAQQRDGKLSTIVPVELKFG